MVVRLQGSGLERGLAYGESARDLILEAAGRWCDGVGDDRDHVLRGLVLDSGFRTIAQQVTPDLVDEIHGIARASGVDPTVIWALNLLDEDWWMRRRLVSQSGCSALGVHAAGAATVIAQTMDLPDWVKGLGVLLEIEPEGDGPWVVAPAYAGIVATTAMNERGIGVCVNSLPQLPTSSRGLPVALMIRHIAAQTNLCAAARVVQEAPHASGQNYLIGAPDGMIGLECGAGYIRRISPDEGWLAHTNHPLGMAPSATDGVVSGSGVRLAHLQGEMREKPPIDSSAALRILGDAPLWREAGGSAFTFYAVAMDLGSQAILHLQTEQSGGVLSVVSPRGVS